MRFGTPTLKFKGSRTTLSGTATRTTPSKRLSGMRALPKMWTSQKLKLIAPSLASKEIGHGKGINCPSKTGDHLPAWRHRTDMSRQAARPLVAAPEAGLKDSIPKYKAHMCMMCCLQFVCHQDMCIAMHAANVASKAGARAIGAHFGIILTMCFKHAYLSHECLRTCVSTRVMMWTKWTCTLLMYTSTAQALCQDMMVLFSMQHPTRCVHAVDEQLIKLPTFA